MNARLTITTLLIYTSIAMAIFFAIRSTIDNTVRAAVFPRVMTEGTVLTYRDSTPDARSVLWEFGHNNNRSSRRNGTYRYTAPGSYIIKLNINNKLVDTFMIYVKKAAPPPPREEVASIYAPSEGIVGKRIAFKILGDVDWVEWQFGESGKTDATDEEAFHSYSNPGKYTVKLRTNLSKQYSFHTIEIKEGYVSTGKEELPTGTGEPLDLKQYIQKIAGAGKATFKKDFDGIVSRFLCGNIHVPVIYNGKSGTDFYLYCQLLRSRAGAVIANVATELDPKTNCINKLTITER